MVAKNLGVFGGEQRNPDDIETFTYFQRTFRVHPEFSALAITDWVEEYGEIDEQSAAAVVAIKKFVRLFVHPDEFDDFWSFAKRNREGPEALMKMGYALIGQLSGFPTGQPSESSGGQQETSMSSEDALSSRVVARLEQRGRPDLALIVTQAAEQRKAG